VKVRLLHLITRLPIGGAEQLLVDVVRRLDRSRFDSIVCCIQETGDLGAEIERAGVPLVCIHRMKSKRFDFRAIADLARLMRRERIDLLHTHLYHANLYGRLAALLAGVPAVASVHNVYTRTKLHRRLLNRLLSRASAKVIAVSEDIKRDLVRYDGIPPDKIVTIHNGIDVGRIDTQVPRQQARERLGIGSDELALGCIARLEEQKGHRFLLESLAMLARDETLKARLKLIIAGDGRLRKDLEDQAAALGVAGRTAFLGMRRDIPEILRALDICVMPSLWEGLSLAMLEAMAAGLPLVISDVGGVSQVVGEDQYGVRVPAGDAAALARAIGSLARAPERRAALGAAAKRRVLESFSTDAMMAKLTRVYESALGN
jgi:glycosyltransferase involved in cell wall biosynthesis